MSLMLKHNISKLFNKMGYMVSRNTSHQTLRCLNYFKINTVFDVGANKGQFASELRKAGFKGKIISFEPLKNVHEVLVSNASTDTDWTVHPQCAIGDHKGEIEINIAGNSVSSSILPMLNSHSSVAPESAYIGTEIVPINTLNNIVPSYLNNNTKSFIKIDTQGFEWQVLDGAEEILNQTTGVLCELSLVELYESQHLWIELVQRLERHGFTLWTLQKGFADATSGRSLQVDGVFFNTRLPENT